MRIMIDENISQRLARSLRDIAGVTEYQIVHVRERAPKGTLDPDWIRGFAADGGTAIVSADLNIRQKPIELLAIMDTGLISFFMPGQWQRCSRWFKAAHLCRWWPAIVQHIHDGVAGDSWEVPLGFSGNGPMRPLRRPDVE